jgi:hypothetical protein
MHACKGDECNTCRENWILLDNKQPWSCRMHFVLQNSTVVRWLKTGWAQRCTGQYMALAQLAAHMPCMWLGLDGWSAVMGCPNTHGGPGDRLAGNFLPYPIIGGSQKQTQQTWQVIYPSRHSDSMCKLGSSLASDLMIMQRCSKWHAATTDNNCARVPSCKTCMHGS